MHRAGAVIPDWPRRARGRARGRPRRLQMIDGRRHFLVHNSWGAGWGDRGSAWISEGSAPEKQLP